MSKPVELTCPECHGMTYIEHRGYMPIIGGFVLTYGCSSCGGAGRIAKAIESQEVEK